MYNRVRKTINGYNMLSRGDSVLIGLSGGPDSVCLLYILKALAPEYKLKLSIAHLNHGLRGKESDADQKFCEELGRKMDMPVFTKKVNSAPRTLPRPCTQGRGKVRGITGGGVKIRKSEDVARNIRYKFLEDTARKIGAAKIALGHNADDEAETVLMRLLRGAGVRGMGGIPPVRRSGDIFIIRPLINVWREEILDYLKKRNIPYRIDSSNIKLDFFRNKIRHELIPFLSRYNPNIKNILLNTGRNMAMVNEYLEEVVSKQMRGCTVSVKRLKNLHPAIGQELIRRIAECLEPELILDASRVDDIMVLAGESEGSKTICLPKGVKVIREYDKLIFAKHQQADAFRGADVLLRDSWFEAELPIPGKVEIPKHKILISSKLCRKGRKIIRNSFEVEMDYDRIAPQLIVRNRRPGDVFQPIGLKGKKKVKDIFIDEKIPERFRDAIPIFVSGNDICWIAGYRIGERFKIGPETKRVLKIKVKGAEKLWQR